MTTKTELRHLLEMSDLKPCPCGKTPPRRCCHMPQLSLQADKMPKAPVFLVGHLGRLVHLRASCGRSEAPTTKSRR